MPLGTISFDGVSVLLDGFASNSEEMMIPRQGFNGVHKAKPLVTIFRVPNRSLWGFLLSFLVCGNIFWDVFFRSFFDFRTLPRYLKARET